MFLDNGKQRDRKQRRYARRGRPRQYDKHLELAITGAMLASIDSARGSRESRLDLIRMAIDQELQRREK
jgi:hypothetical protein